MNLFAKQKRITMSGIDILKIESFIDKLTQLFNNPATEKKDITSLMKTFLVNFDHQETGRYLDSKM